MRVLVPTALEPTGALFRGVACLVPFRVVELGVRAPGPGRNDSLNGPLRAETSPS